MEGGYPTDATVTKLYDEMDFQRAVQAYLWAVPLVNFAQWQEAYETVFGQQDGDLDFWQPPTLPGRGLFAYFRVYAPTEPCFDRS